MDKYPDLVSHLQLTVNETQQLLQPKQIPGLNVEPGSEVLFINNRPISTEKMTPAEVLASLESAVVLHEDNSWYRIDIIKENLKQLRAGIDRLTFSEGRPFGVSTAVSWGQNICDTCLRQIGDRDALGRSLEQLEDHLSRLADGKDFDPSLQHWEPELQLPSDLKDAIGAGLERNLARAMHFWRTDYPIPTWSEVALKVDRVHVKGEDAKAYAKRVKRAAGKYGIKLPNRDKRR